MSTITTAATSKQERLTSSPTSPTCSRPDLRTNGARPSPIRSSAPSPSSRVDVPSPSSQVSTRSRARKRKFNSSDENATNKIKLKKAQKDLKTETGRAKNAKKFDSQVQKKKKKKRKAPTDSLEPSSKPMDASQSQSHSTMPISAPIHTEKPLKTNFKARSRQK